jgi:cell division protein FtsL
MTKSKDGKQNKEKNTVQEKDKDKKDGKSTRVALIGLIGTILTVCGSLAGALISSAVTVYRVEREAQQITLSAGDAEQELNIDTAQVFISRQDAAALDPDTYFVDLEHGLIIHRAMDGWGEVEQTTLGEHLAESGATLPPGPVSDRIAAQPVYRIRHGVPFEAELDSTTLVDGQPIPQYITDALTQFYGSAPWHIPYYNEILVILHDRDLGLFESLPDLLMRSYPFSGGHVNQLITSPENDFISMQTSTVMTNVQVDGQTTMFTLERWYLYAATDDTYYEVEIQFVPQSGQSFQIWQDLQTYMNSLCVIK